MDDFDLSPGEQDLQEQADRMKDMNERFRIWKRGRSYVDKMNLKMAKAKSKQKVNEIKAKNKPVLKFISTVGMLIFCMKFMQDHHTDKLTKDDYKYMETIGKAMGLSPDEVNKITQTASNKVKQKKASGSTSSSSTPYWQF